MPGDRHPEPKAPERSTGAESISKPEGRGERHGTVSLTPEPEGKEEDITDKTTEVEMTGVWETVPVAKVGEGKADSDTTNVDWEPTLGGPSGPEETSSTGPEGTSTESEDKGGTRGKTEGAEVPTAEPEAAGMEELLAEDFRPEEARGF